MILRYVQLIPVTVPLALTLVSCAPEPVRPHRARSVADGVTPAESVAMGAHVNAVKRAASAASGEAVCTLTWQAPVSVSGCDSPVPSVVPEVPWLQHSGQAKDPGEIEQRLPISIKFPGPVRTVALSSVGGLLCSGTYGRMVGYRNNVLVAQADNVLIDPSDCGYDDATYGVKGALPPEVDIDSLLIEGVEPWTFLVLGVPGRALLKYTIQYQPSPPQPLDCQVVTRGQSTSCVINVAVDAVSGWRFDGKLDTVAYGRPDSVHISSSSTSLSWSGTVVLSGRVSAFVTLNGVSDSLEAMLTVGPRSGTAWRWSEANWPFHEHEAASCDYTDFLANAPRTRLAANRRTAGCKLNQTRIEPSVLTAADSGFSAAVVQGGPNDSLWYVVAGHYSMDRTSEVNPFIEPGGRADTLRNRDEQRRCRQALHLGPHDPVVVNFYTYNTVCRGFSLDSMFAAIWRHEGFGSRPPLDPNLANGHEARARIAARDSITDPYHQVESLVEWDYSHLRTLVAYRVYDADSRIVASSDTAHAFVRDNYILNGECGTAWVFNSDSAYYVRIPMEQMLNGQLVCM